MSQRRGSILPRRRIFIGCEGEGEQAYAALLQRIADDCQRPHIALDLQVLGGGDPLALVQAAIQKERGQTKKHGGFRIKAVFIDYDKIGQAPARDREMHALAVANQLQLIWQRPCLEGLLLRHLPGCQGHRPPTSALAFNALQAEWPEYQKPMPARRLSTRIGITEIRAAAIVEPDLNAFLTSIGFI
jgi:hypothetical protein